MNLPEPRDASNDEEIRVLKGYRFPTDLYYHREHSWGRVEADGNVRVGMNHFFAKAAGVIVNIEFPEEDSDVEQGGVCGKVQSSKWIGSLVSPVKGRILKVNRDLLDDTTAVNKDPYGRGWIFVIKPLKLQDDLKRLLRPDQLDDWLVAEIEKAETEKQKRKERRIRY